MKDMQESCQQFIKKLLSLLAQDKQNAKVGKKQNEKHFTNNRLGC